MFLVKEYPVLLLSKMGEGIFLLQWLILLCPLYFIIYKVSIKRGFVILRDLPGC